MIKSIHLQNFQSHADTILDLAPGVNLIVGPSDVGKTAVLRALRWVLYNRPGGTAFCRYDTRETAVAVSLTEGPTVERTRRGSVNLYTVDDLELEGFGQAVPEEVSEALRIPQLSWQGQLDAPFLLSASPGEVARVLNDVVDLSAIDRAISHSSSRLRTSIRTTKEAEEQLGSAREDLTALDWIDKAREAVEAAERAEAELDALREKAGDLEAVIRQLGWRRDKLDALPPKTLITRMEKAIEEAHAEAAEMNEAQDRIDLLEQDILSVTDARARKAEAVQRAEELQEEFDRLMPEVCPLCGTKLEEER